MPLEGFYIREVKRDYFAKVPMPSDPVVWLNLDTTIADCLARNRDRYQLGDDLEVKVEESNMVLKVETFACT